MPIEISEPRPVLTVAEAMEELPLSKTAFYQAIHRGEIPSIRIGRKLFIRTKRFREILDGN